MQISAPTTPPVTPQQTAGFRPGLANGMRATGAGFATASDQIGTAADKAYIYPVESAFTFGRVLSAATQDMNPKVHSIAGKVGTVLTYIGAYDNLMVAGMLRTPGAVADDVLNMVANKIDGGQGAVAAASKDYSVGWSGLAHAQDVRDAAAAAAASQQRS